MRCLSCDKRLNDRESTRKYSSSGTFVDLCDRCFSTISDEIPDVEGASVDYCPIDDGDEEYNGGESGTNSDYGYSEYE